MSEADRMAKWKSTVIGGAKSRALYDAGIGLEFYGDIYAPEENLDEQEVDAEESKTKSPKKETPKEKTYSESGMPIPQPKRKSAEKNPSEKEVVSKAAPESVKADANPIEVGMSLEVAKTLKADCGNYAGMALGDIYETAPKNLVFLARNSKSEDVKTAATIIISSDEELRTKYA